METVKTIVKKELKFSNKTKIELEQAINNLSWQNESGQYTQLIAEYQDELNRRNAELVVAPKVITVVHSELEQKAIMSFNRDRRFSITE